MVFNKEDYKYDGFVVSEIEEGFAHVQFNRPKNLNAFSTKNWQDYGEILYKLDADSSTKVILISSTVAKSFSSGLDLKDALVLFQGGGKDDSRDFKERYDGLNKYITDFQHAIGAPARIKTPTICLLNGLNIGLALDISSATTIRVATQDAKFSIREIKVGIIADIGVLQRLPSIVNNQSRLNQYALTGENWSAQDAWDLGFVSKVVPDLKSGIDYCIELGQSINTNKAWTIQGTKNSLQQIYDGGLVQDGLKEVAIVNAFNIDNDFGPKL
ncbi:ClpP/crotonase [Hyphopichia burtonii NRRL Y-1933]|uniref:ClpP/crotonase n=1 Tax=Hyphopichia burtonii NRRL Y-1933 TaxID=984485 RepID=A0A1E4RFG8_9ASCO|nr:ClpP/crotonase [Hyphopichia burtonii NRRL Y-1933]ODV66012.1 ClpP/crotonase [Hyphopichia burtonii NRRL Y-1933]